MTSLRAVLEPGAVRLGLGSVDRFAAVRITGQILVDVGAVPDGYIEAMCERERSISTFIGEGVAIPHGTEASRNLVERAALSVAQFPDGIDWNGNLVYLCVGIASATDEHITVLSRLAQALHEPDTAERLRKATTAEEMLEILSPISSGPR